jgi:hypothetical protein
MGGLLDPQRAAHRGPSVDILFERCDPRYALVAQADLLFVIDTQSAELGVDQLAGVVGQHCR